MLSHFMGHVRKSLFVFYLVHLNRLPVHVMDLVCQPLGFKYFYQKTAAHEMSAKVYRWTHEQFKVGIIFALTNLTLAFMDG